MNIFKLFLRILLSFIFVVSFFSCALAQEKSSKNKDYTNYYLQVYKADSLFYTGNFNSSYKILNSLFKEYEPVELIRYKPYKLFVYSAIKVNASKNYKKLMKNLISRYGYCYNDLVSDSIFLRGLKIAKIDSSDFKKLRKEYLNSLNKDLRKIIIEMNERDQAVRLSNIENKEKQVAKVDKKNDSLLKKIYKNYGFPTKELIGAASIDCKTYDKIDLLLIYNHMSYHGDYKYHREKLTKYVKEGKCDPVLLGHMIDRRNQILGKDPVYYLFFNTYFENNPSKAKKIDSLRKNAGLPTLKQEEFWYKRFK
ncbi:hypothetical protein [Mesonia maritima]|uniref:Lipoprotein n=1 Tax=Mesonia maritima TaxID=1793873 RepID=A0ABU1K7Q4_9FLAO|nr:hypothetical protein [Mesonia maritima]MDR6301651.1 hypothetical protein [Mesonia maritima]